MNFGQMRVMARDALTAGLGINTNISPDLMFVDAEIKGWLNRGQRYIHHQMRKARSNYFHRVINTTDTPILLGQVLFDPATIRITPNVANYTLPPDFVSAKLMTDLSSGALFPGTRFSFVNNLANEMFRGLMFVNANSTQREYLCAVIDKRTLLLRPIPQETRDFQLVYEYLLPSLIDYSVGTADVINGSTVVTLHNDDALNNVAIGDEFILGTSTGLTIPDPSVDYPVIVGVAASQLTLGSKWTGATASGYNYTASRVSAIPAMHHDLLPVFATRQGAMKGPNPAIDLANMMGEEFNTMMRALLDDIEGRQFSDQETSEPFMSDQWDFDE
jgi:hypothetical protein